MVKKECIINVLILYKDIVMDGIVFFVVAMIVLGWAIILAVAINFTRKKRLGVLKRSHFLIAGVFLSSAILFLPIYRDIFGLNSITFKTVLLSIHNAIRLFVVDADFETISGFIQTLGGAYAKAYEITFAVLFVLAPALTATFLLSFLGDFSSYAKCFFSFHKEAYVFSDLNERSLALAKDIIKNKKGVLIIFTDVLTSNDESNDLVENARELGAVLFKKSIAHVHFNAQLKRKKITFFAISEKEDENVSHSSALIKKYGNLANRELYLFSMSKQSELFLENIDNFYKMKVRRVNESSSLVNRYLYDNGKDIFNGTHAEEDGLKVISAVVLGMGSYGTQMAKALPWFCQLPGYRFKLNVFDKDEHAESRFKALCPDYLNPKCNKVYVDGEAQYDINVHSGIDFKTHEFGEELQKIKDASFVFVALGTDEDNIGYAVQARMYFERIGVHPKIVAVVYDGEKVKQIKNATCATDKKNRKYDIEYTGTLQELYSVNVIINSELEDRAVDVHMGYFSNGDETLTPEQLKEKIAKHMRSFYMIEYNYNSSCASAMHNKVRVECKIAGADKDPADLTKEEKDLMEKIEHRRWNAYTRSCGYVWSNSKTSDSRNDLAKMHHNLVPFEELSKEDKEKDAKVTYKKKQQ